MEILEIVEISPEEQIALHYKAMLDSVWLINGIVSNREMLNLSEKDKKDFVARNVMHLEIMLNKDFWTTQDMSPVNTAIVSGKKFIL